MLEGNRIKSLNAEEKRIIAWDYSTIPDFKSKYKKVVDKQKSNRIYFLQILAERTTKVWTPTTGKVNSKNGVGYKQ